MREIKRAKMIVCGHDLHVVRTLVHARLARLARLAHTDTRTTCKSCAHLPPIAHTVPHNLKIKIVNKQEFCPWDIQ